LSPTPNSTGLTDSGSASAAEAAARVESDAFLDSMEGKGGGTRFFAYLLRGGPGYLQSAMTLGGGTAISSIYAGRMFGYDLLWVAPVGMLIGVLMLGVLASLTLRDETRPFEGMAQNAGRPFAWAWAVGALVASIIWHFPQYALAGAAVSDAAEVAGASISPALAAWPVLGVALVMSLLYGRSPRLVRIYETCVKLLVIGVIICFGLVVAATAGETDWAGVLRGFIPSVPEARGGVDPWTMIASGIAAAVGINMVFLYPYSLRARGWGARSQGIARFDLIAGMLIPYTLATALVVIATANTIPWLDGEAVQKMKPPEAARAFGAILGETNGRLVFDLGLVGMALSTIALHMVCSGFALAEMLGKKHDSWTYRIGTLLPIPGVLGPLVWNDLLWLVIPTNIVCGLFLPVTYLGFILWTRKERSQGSARTGGAKHAITVVLMSVFTLFLTIMFVRTLLRLF
jgi:manganese transport protein